MDFEAFLKEYGIYFSIGLFVLIALFLLFYFLYPLFNRHKQVEKRQVDANQFYLALGGEDNVKNLTLNGSRLSVELVDLDSYNLDKLKELGVVRLIKMKTKIVLLVDSSFKSLTKEK